MAPPQYGTGLNHQTSRPAGDTFQSSAQSSATVSATDSKKLSDFARTQKTFQAASNYQPTYKWLGQGVIPVHNPTIAEKLQSQYTPETFRQLFDFCKQQGVFKLDFVPGHDLVKTAGTTAAEDSSMGRAHWVSDTLYVRDLVRDTNPLLWTKSLRSLAQYYDSEQPAFERIIRQPKLYHEGDNTQGLAHIFEPDTLTRYKEWQVNYRLESHGRALKAFCEQLQEDVARNPFQVSQSLETNQPMMKAVCNLAHYFQAINYPTARSCGPWEDMASPGGTTSDIDAVRSGYQSLHQLLFNPNTASSPAIQQIRQQLQHHENQLNQKLGGTLNPLFQSPEPLNRLIQSGEQEVRQRLLSGPCPKESPGSREMDSALTLVANSDLRLGNTVESDVQNHLHVLDSLSNHLVRNNGMIRYLPYTIPAHGQRIFIFDSYLGPNSNLAADPDGKLSANKTLAAWNTLKKSFPTLDAAKIQDDDPVGYMLRGLLAKPDKEAEWFLNSELSLGYGQQLAKVLAPIQQQKRLPSPNERQLIQHCLHSETESLNRSYARVTGAGQNGQPLLKANGENCPSYKVPEAYQYVSAGQQGPLVAMPGVNTPLSWATASLYAASKQYEKNLSQLNSLGFMAD